MARVPPKGPLVVAVTPRQHGSAATTAGGPPLARIGVWVGAALRHVAVGGEEALAPPLTSRGVEACTMPNPMALVTGLAWAGTAIAPAVTASQWLQPAEGAALAVS